jgi:hypothetical protein
MNPLFSFFIFLLVLFLYLHITAQWKKSEDLEVYETDYVNPIQIQEICSIKQPVLFKFEPICPLFYDKFQLSKMANYDNHDVFVKDIHDYRSSKPVYSVKLPLRSATTLLSSDTGARYFSESNQEFLEETGLDALCHSVDDHLKPPFTIQRKYDLIQGSKHVCLPLRYHLNHQMFLFVTQGKIRVKMSPPKFSKYLDPIRDYDNYEFKSTLNPWNPAANHRENMEKCKFIDFEVYPGYSLFIPPYWWYTICFSGDETTTIGTACYNNIPNVLAHMNHIGMHYLQMSNISSKPAKRIIPSLDGFVEKPLVEPIEIIEEEIPKVSTNKEIVTNAGVYKTTGEQ